MATALDKKTARYERAATRAYLMRKLRGCTLEDASIVAEILDWVKSRQSRYDKIPGGL